MKYIFVIALVWLCGFILKFYDDLDELYLIKEGRWLEIAKSFFTALTCFFLFVVANNKYDILLVIYYLSLCTLDWYAYANAYFFSILVVFAPLCLFLVCKNRYSFKISILVFASILYTICSPVTETKCFEMNGLFHEILKYMGFVPKNSTSLQFNNLTKTELEVSHFKLKTRITSVLFTLLVGILLFYFIKYNSWQGTEMGNFLNSAIYICGFINGYMFLSVINQYYVLYHDNGRLIDIHNKINQEPEVVEKEQDPEPEVVEKDQEPEPEPEPEQEVVEKDQEQEVVEEEQEESHKSI
jgi:hypothetical protein